MKCLLDAFVRLQGVFMHLSVQGSPRPSSSQQRGVAARGEGFCTKCYSCHVMWESGHVGKMGGKTICFCFNFILILGLELHGTLLRWSIVSVIQKDKKKKTGQHVTRVSVHYYGSSVSCSSVSGGVCAEGCPQKCLGHWTGPANGPSPNIHTVYKHIRVLCPTQTRAE